MTGPTLGGVPNKPKTPLQSFRCDADVWRAAQEKAKSEGTDLSKVLREFLGKYLRD